MPHTQTVSIGLWIAAGSRHESTHQNGLSHFLEHMAFKGTKNRSARDIAEQFDDIGGYLNACTSHEYTSYYAKVLPEDFNTAGDILADILLHPTFDKEELEKERQVILQEIAMCHDTPDDIIFDIFQHTAFPNQPLGRSILGTEERVLSFTQEDLKQYVATHYHAAHMVLAVAGAISHQKAVAYAEKYFASLPSSKAQSVIDATYHGGHLHQQRTLEQTHLMIGFAGLPYHHEDYHALRLLTSILGGGMSSRLFQEIREKRGLAYTIHAFHNCYADQGLFSVYSSTTPHNIEALGTVVAQELHKACTTITPQELARAKKQAIAGLLMAQDSTLGKSEELGHNLTCLNHHVETSEIIATLETIALDKIHQLLQQLITSSSPAIVTIGPGTTTILPETFIRHLSI